MKIVLCGPPHSGKSCLRFGLKEAMKNTPRVYPYVITACPDGEGSWFQETFSTNSELAVEEKKKYKGTFSPELVQKWADDVKNCNLPLVIVDIGGIVDDKNEEICRHATHAILLAGDLKLLPEWRTFCSKLHIEIIAEIYSDYHGACDTLLILEEDGVYRGSIHSLKRGDMSIKNRPTVLQLSEIISAMLEREQDVSI